MVKIGWLVVFLFLCLSQVTAQTIKNIKVNANKTPLSQVLLDLKQNYGLQFAYDNDLLTQYKITLNRTFNSENDALSFLIKNLPLEVEKSGEVFLIIPLSENPAEPEVTRISGQVLEAFTHETLPYSYILINRRSIQSDQQGNFNFIASADTSYNLQISHLGYFIYDTVVDRSLNRQFFLTPQIERIKEVRVVSNPIEKSTLIGDKAGRMKINHQIAPILPGHGDNSVFNLLRLLPGVLAAGEQSNDLFIWGGYESHSKIQFDGFTVFGLKGFNDNISVVNPFVVKNIEVMKGGYEARYGGRVGGIVDIIGKDGTLQKPTFTFNINSTTLNSMLQLPLSKKSSLLAAYRQTYYQLYDPTSINLFAKGNNNGNGNQLDGGIDFAVKPDYRFRDANIKYVYKGEKGSHLSLSLYGGGDNFLYDMEGAAGNNNIIRVEEEENRQLGGALQFNYPWQNGNSSSFSIGYSAFEQQSLEENDIENSRKDISRITKKVVSENTVNEINLKAEHVLGFQKGHKLLLGLGLVNNQVQLSRLSKDEVVFDIDDQSPRLISYVQDELPLGESIELKTGLRLVYATKLQNLYFEPRISASMKVLEGFKVNASWGLYNQFFAKTSIVDSSFNYDFFWTNADDIDIPVLSAQHSVAGISYNKNGFTFSTEGYYKTTEGINRFFNRSKRLEQGFYEGISRSYGLDVYVKKEYKRHMAWVSYTLSKTEELFPFYLNRQYRLAPHHQKHELKFAGILNYKSFYLSANYVYGSGFERFTIETGDGTKLNQAYKRCDAALVYKFKPGKVKAEAGISILNVFNTDNIKYANLRVTSVDDISLVGIYADAVPFTPAVFLKIEL